MWNDLAQPVTTSTYWLYLYDKQDATLFFITGNFLTTYRAENGPLKTESGSQNASLCFKQKDLILQQIFKYSSFFTQKTVSYGSLTFGADDRNFNYAYDKGYAAGKKRKAGAEI